MYRVPQASLTVLAVAGRLERGVRHQRTVWGVAVKRAAGESDREQWKTRLAKRGDSIAAYFLVFSALTVSDCFCAGFVDLDGAKGGGNPTKHRNTSMGSKT
jgi:hypothetical protein